MSPQPKKNQSAQTADTPDTPDTIEERLLDQAADLAEQKTALFAKVDANRKALRNLKDTGMLSDEQVVEVDKFYPPVQRKPKDDAAASDGAGQE